MYVCIRMFISWIKNLYGKRMYFQTEILKLWVNEKRVQTLEHEATKMVA